MNWIFGLFKRNKEESPPNMISISKSIRDCDIFYDTYFKSKVVITRCSKWNHTDKIHIELKGLNGGMETSCNNFDFNKRFKPVLRA